MDILIVTDPSALSALHVHSARCSDDMREDVKQALRHLDVKLEDRTIDGMAIDLSRGKAFWLWINHRSYCFEKIEV